MYRAAFVLSMCFCLSHQAHSRTEKNRCKVKHLEIPNGANISFPEEEVDDPEVWLVNVTCPRNFSAPDTSHVPAAPDFSLICVEGTWVEVNNKSLNCSLIGHDEASNFLPRWLRDWMPCCSPAAVILAFAGITVAVLWVVLLCLTRIAIRNRTNIRTMRELFKRRENRWTPGDVLYEMVPGDFEKDDVDVLPKLDLYSSGRGRYSSETNSPQRRLAGSKGVTIATPSRLVTSDESDEEDLGDGDQEMWSEDTEEHYMNAVNVHSNSDLVV